MEKIIATTPTVIEAVPEKVFDAFHLARLEIDWSNPNSPATVVAKFVKYREDKGLKEVSPTDQVVEIRLNDLLDESAKDAELSEVLNLLLAYLTKRGVNQGVI